MAMSGRMFSGMRSQRRNLIVIVAALLIGGGGALAGPTVVAAVQDGYLSYFLARTLSAFGCF